MKMEQTLRSQKKAGNQRPLYEEDNQYSDFFRSVGKMRGSCLVFGAHCNKRAVGSSSSTCGAQGVGAGWGWEWRKEEERKLHRRIGANLPGLLCFCKFYDQITFVLSFQGCEANSFGKQITKARFVIKTKRQIFCLFNMLSLPYVQDISVGLHLL